MRCTPSYLPDAHVVVDFTNSKIEQIGPDRVKVSHIGGKQRPPTLKCLLVARKVLLVKTCSSMLALVRCAVQNWLKKF